MRKLNYLHVLWIALCMVALSGAACQQINPIAAAGEDPERRAYAIYGTYVIFAEKAADLAENDTLPRGVRLGLVQAEERASPVMNSVLSSLAAFEQTRAEYVAGTANASALETVARNLNGWVERAVPLVDELVRNVRGAES